MGGHTQDIDALYDDGVFAKIEITVRRNGAMSTAGSIEDLNYALAILDHAKDAVRQYHARKRPMDGIIVPAKDTDLPPLPPGFEMPR
jgi:hypothetical protein